MSLATEILDGIIKASRLLDVRLERLESEVAVLNAKNLVLQKQLEKMRDALRRPADEWDDVEIIEEFGPDPLGTNSDPRVALPEVDELSAAFARIIS